ncbi:Na-translocating system protein MpsC family protein [Alkaliphilus serpentinus]|uniref:Stage 0 sporulation protein A homolog n=1 Tax=Alkaliphilus serpentinus TaxID=1482731 RepID=A0A833HRH0_9FIRM|nr:Na-translocating system protein MpsC family protein [Alkaliphilus serpentinus]KAB3533227.1 response regulator [Alkaliphilus serpentinus]
MSKEKLDNLLCNLQLLYVEDEEFTRGELSKFLKRRVGKLYCCENGQEGLAIYKERNPDLIITDLKMPLMDGLEMVKMIRNIGGNTPVIIISALSDSETILQAVDLGIVKYVVKPVDTNTLIDAMKELAANILKEKMNKTIVNNIYVLSKEEKIELEKKVASEIAYFIKSYTGKGPQYVQAFIQGNEITAKALGVLTVYEASLIANRKNYSLVDYNRSLLYREYKTILEKSIGDIVGSDCKLLEFEADSLHNMDKITFSFF